MKDLKNIALHENEYRAIETAVKELKEMYPVETVIIFGSRSRGSGDEFSDIDLLIVTGRTLIWREEKDVVDRLFDIGMEFDVIFSPIFASHEEWDGGIFRQFPVFGDIMRDGALVA
jgi:predicted nucleotidyltransferase